MAKRLDYLLGVTNLVLKPRTHRLCVLKDFLLPLLFLIIKVVHIYD